MKELRIIALPFLALLLAGCGEVMNSTANLIDAVAGTISEEDEQKEQQEIKEAAPVVQTQQAEPAKATATPAKPKVTSQVEKDNSSMTHVQVTAKDANVRAEPSLNAQVVTAGTLYDTFTYLNEKVKTSDGRTWYKVSYAGGVGYMSSAVGTLINENAYTSNNGGNTIIITQSEGNVRSEPSLNGKVVYTAKKGEELYYTGEAVNASDGRVWYKVVTNGKTGFVSKRVGALSEDYYYGFDESELVVTNAEGNVRAAASLNAAVIYTAKKGESLYYTGYYEKTSDGRTWYEVEVYGT